MILSRRSCRSPRTAAAVVEFALLAPFFAALFLGMFEISRVLLVKEALSNAAQEACRVAILPGTNSSRVTTIATEVLQREAISGFSILVQVNDRQADVSTAKRNDKISVRVSVPTSRVSWVGSIFIKGNTVQSETVTMQRQG